MTTSTAIQSAQKTRSASAGGSARRVQEPCTRPPSYVNVPTSVAYAPVPDALVVTMVRILGLCWRNGYRRTPPLTLEQLARLLDRPRSTLHRHLDILEHELGWLRRERQDRRFILRPLPPSCSSVPTELLGTGQSPVHEPGISSPVEDADALEEPEWGDDDHNCSHCTSVAVEPPHSGHNCSHYSSESSENAASCNSAPAKLLGDERLQSHGVRQDLVHALAEVGIESPARERIALDPAVEPDWVPAWQLWTQHPDRANLSNPAGYIVRRLQRRSRPPEPYLRLARLSPDQMRKLRSSYWLSQEQLDLDPVLREVRPLYLELFKDQIRG